MKRHAIITALAALAITATAAPQAMRYDGQTRRGPVAIPRTALKYLSGNGGVSNPQSATWAQLNRAGYYQVQRATAPTNMVIVSRTWPAHPNAKGVFVEQATEIVTEEEHEAQQAAAQQAQIETDAERDMNDTVSIRACIVEDYADYQVERDEINKIADRVFGVGNGSRLPIETLQEYAERRKDRYIAICGAGHSVK